MSIDGILETQRDLLASPYHTSALLDNARESYRKTKEKLDEFEEFNSQLATRPKTNKTDWQWLQQPKVGDRPIETKVLKAETDLWTKLINAYESISSSQKAKMELEGEKMANAGAVAKDTFFNDYTKWQGNLWEGTNLEIALDDAKRNVTKFEAILREEPKNKEAQRSLEYWTAFNGKAMDEKSSVDARVKERADYISENQDGFSSAMELSAELKAKKEREKTLWTVVFTVVGLLGVAAYTRFF